MYSDIFLSYNYMYTYMRMLIGNTTPNMLSPTSETSTPHNSGKCLYNYIYVCVCVCVCVCVELE